MIMVKLILFLGVAIVHCDPIHESDAKASPPLSLKWTSKFSMGLKLPDGREDEMTLRHADTAGGVAVPCLYKGTLENDVNGHVAVLGCRDGDNTQVTLVSKYTNSTMFNILKNNKTEEILNPYTATINEEEEIIELDEEASLQGRPKRSTYPILPPDFDEYPLSLSSAVLDPVPADLVYGVEVAYDDTFLIKMGFNKEAAEQYILAVMAHAQAYLLHDTLGSRIHLHIRNKPKHLQGKSLKINDVQNAISPSMEIAKKIPSQFALIIFIYSDNEDTWMGVANRRYGCDPDRARAIVKWRCSVQKAAMTCAHEIAYLLGPYHDEQEDNTKKLGLDDCSGDGLMSDSVDIDDQKEQWSVCTQMRFARWYNNYGKSCTADRLIEGVACSADSNSWATPCLCSTSLCTGKHTCCEAATGTCIGFKNLDDVLAEMSWIKNQVMEQSTELSGLKSHMLELTTKTGNHDNLLSQQSTEMSEMKGEIKKLKTKTENHDNLHNQHSTKMSEMKAEMKKLTNQVEPWAELHDILNSQASVCSGYTPLTDSWRNIDYVNRGTFPYHCDQTGSSSEYTNLGWGSWYRFTGAAGNKLPTAPAPVGGGPTYGGQEICGTNGVAFILSGGNPTIQDGIVTRDVCFEYSSDSYEGKTTIGVAACRDMHGDYFVYQLQPASACYFAYCAID